MVFYITYLKDSINNNYLGIKIDNQTIQPFLNQLKDILPTDEAEVYIGNQQKRDNGSYHITTINVMDYNRLSKEMGISNFVNSLEPIFKYEIDDLKMLGLGTARRNENQAYFVVCKSEKLDSIRKRYNLPEHDFHITLGFKWRDVFGVRKNQVLEKNSFFLKLLKQEFYKKENFNFVKSLPDFDLNKDFDIIPVEINETYLKILCDDTIMDIGVLEDSDGNSFLKILTKYKAEGEYNRLPLTEVYKILEKIK